MTVSAEAQSRMAEELDLLQQLVDLAVAKKAALFENDLEALRQIIDGEEKAMAKAEALHLHHEEGLDKTPEGRQLLQKRAALIAKLKEVNLLNQQLLEDALAVVDYSLRLIHGAEESDLYGSSGRVETVGNRSILNWRG